VLSYMFLVATMSASGHMLGVVAVEKENRTMEILISSISPAKLVMGKALGLMAGTLAQLAIYLATLVIVLSYLVTRYDFLQNVAVPWQYLGLMALFFLPSYALIAGLMITIGSAVTEMQQGQQIAGMLSLFFTAPLIMMPIFFNDPGQPLVVAMTLFPPTSFITVSLRWGLGAIPDWQLVAGWVLLVTAALFTIWVASRVLRVGMLRYGQPLKMAHIAALLRG